MPSSDGGLGSALVGEKIMINHRHVAVTKLLGEGGFSYVYLVKEISDTSAGDSLSNTVHGDGVQRSGSGTGRSGSVGNGSSRRQGSMGRETEKKEMVLKVTSIISRQQRDIAEKEAKLLSRLSHPSIIKMFDTCYRTVQHSSGKRRGEDPSKQKERPQHLILMENCEGGHALDVCAKMAAAGERFDLSTLIIAFGQICNAVSYLHAQRPPIVHRDLKPANFLIKNGAYKLCDFGSAVFGHVDLKTPKARAEAEEVVQKTTTQMFRAPEMVDLYMAKKLTQATDVWALGACLYSLAFLQNCFEEGSNLAILSRKYKIPDDNPYGEGLVELIDRMLTVDSKARADMTEVILCLSAVYSGRPLPPRKERKESKAKKEKEGEKSKPSKKKKNEKAGTFRTDGQGIYQDGFDPDTPKKPVAKKLNPNSAAARRRMAAGGDTGSSEFASFHSRFDEVAAQAGGQAVNQDMAFSTADNPFASAQASDTKSERSEGDANDIFASFDEDADVSMDDNVKDAFAGDATWGETSGSGQAFDAFASFSPDQEQPQITEASKEDDDDVDESGAEAGGETSGDGREGDGHRRRSKSNSARRHNRRKPPSRSRSVGKEDSGELADGVAGLDMDDEDGPQADGEEGREGSKSSRSRRTSNRSRANVRRTVSETSSRRSGSGSGPREGQKGSSSTPNSKERRKKNPDS